MRNSWAIALIACALLLSGCSAVPVLTSSNNQTGAIQGTPLRGRVHGGQQPISGASIYLYAVTTTGYGAASTSLLKSPGYVTTASDGSFSITGDYTCPAGAQVYIYSIGGNPGLASGTDNTAAGLLAGLGSCSALTATQFIFVNEVSTIATTYALAGYATDATHISSSGTALAVTGVANAMNTITNLETLNTGVALAATPASVSTNKGIVAQTQINTLANILAACINTTGPSSTSCATLFATALSGGTTGTQPTDTATAALNIAHNPAANVAALFALQGSSPPFQPDLASAPNDFTNTITFTGGGLDLPSTIAIDASGNVWVVSSVGYLSEFNPLGVALSGITGYSFSSNCIDSPNGVAIDSSGNVWIANQGSTSNLCEFSSAGIQNANAPFTGGGLDTPRGIAIGGSNHVWVANHFGNSLSEFNSSGSPVSSSGFAPFGIDEPWGVAVDVSGNVWSTNEGGTPNLSELNSTGSPVGTSPFTGGGLNGPEGIAIDGSGNFWAANYAGNSVSEFNSSGSPNPLSPFTGGGLDAPFNIAVDGSGNVWAANYSNNSISELKSSGTAISGTNGFQGTLTGLNGLISPYSVAIDGSGNAWVTNYGYDTITEFVGAASPVVTPLAANLVSPYGTHAVNKP